MDKQSLGRNPGDSSLSAKHSSVSENKGLSKTFYRELFKQGENQDETHSNTSEKTIQEKGKEIQDLKSPSERPLMIFQSPPILDSSKSCQAPMFRVGSFEDSSNDLVNKDIYATNRNNEANRANLFRRTESLGSMRRTKSQIESYNLQNSFVNSKNENIKLKEQLLEKDKSLQALHQKLEKKNTKLQTSEQDIKTREHQINDLNQGLKAREHQINSLNLELERKNLEMNDLTEGLKQKDLEIKNLNEKLKQKDQEIEASIQDISKKIGYCRRILGKLIIDKNDYNIKERNNELEENKHQLTTKRSNKTEEIEAQLIMGYFKKRVEGPKTNSPRLESLKDILLDQHELKPLGNLIDKMDDNLVKALENFIRKQHDRQEEISKKIEQSKAESIMDYFDRS